MAYDADNDALWWMDGTAVTFTVIELQYIEDHADTEIVLLEAFTDHAQAVAFFEARAAARALPVWRDELPHDPTNKLRMFAGTNAHNLTLYATETL